MTLTKMLVPIRLYCLKWTKFSQLILRKIIKIVDTRCQILRLKCTKFYFGDLTALPRQLDGFYGRRLFLRGGGKGGGEKMEGEEKEGEEKRRGGEGKKGGKGRGGITMGSSLPKENFLVTSLLMFSFVDNEVEAVGASIK